MYLKTRAEPPPAHSYSRNYSLPQQSLPIQDLHSTPSMKTAPVPVPVPLSCSPGIHIPSPISITNVEVGNVIQPTPLDLGMFNRHYNDDVATKQLSPSFPTKSSENIPTNRNQISVDNIKASHMHLDSSQTHPNNSINPNVIDDSSLDSSFNSGNDQHDDQNADTKVLSNGADDNNKNDTISNNIEAREKPVHTILTDDGLTRHLSSTNSSPIPSPSSVQGAPALTAKLSIDFEKASGNCHISFELKYFFKIISDLIRCHVDCFFRYYKFCCTKALEKILAEKTHGYNWRR